MNEKYDIAIIGGGISGLSLAYNLAQMDRKVLLIEKTNRVGGAIESLCFQDFSIDLGAHTAYNSYTTLLELATDNNAEQFLQARKKQKYFFVTPKGFQKLTKLLSFGTLLVNIPKVFTTKKNGKSVKEYFSRILGEKNYTNFAQHFFKAVLCQEAENYPSAFFLKKRENRNKSVPRSFTFPKGIETFSNTLAEHINITICTETEVQNIEKNGKYFSISSSKGNWDVPNIAFATYANEVANLTKNIAPSLSEKLQKIPYKTVSSLGIIVKKDAVPNLQEFAGLLTTTNDFTSIVSRDIAPHKTLRGFTIHAQGKVAETDLQQKLCEVLKIAPTEICIQQYKNNFLPALQKGHEDFLSDLETTIEKTANIYLTGNYFQGLSLEDCLLRSKSEALRYISTP